MSSKTSRGCILKTPNRLRPRTPSRARGNETAGRRKQDLPKFDPQDHQALPCEAFPSSGVKTTIVLKPLNFDEKLRGDERSVVYDDSTKCITVAGNETKATSNAKSVRTSTTVASYALSDEAATNVTENVFDSSFYDSVLDGSCSRSEFHKETVPIVTAVMEGKHAAIMAYGQTGSGKTYMMEGQFDERDSWGIIPFAIEELLIRTSG
eukprot:9486260-Pyramimonas_sp.AAC.3